ncbi:TIM44-like domain-containing protein [Pseudovibrio brasiliensis]|uniref:TIM44-like domain-containing protein n=1 Tax=Pseudovibrio brasiliensis TaxID=1898042 RepID=A0ABX8AP98_9HYPH|nr:TIM44-like domain-containing protein [Pseudovibrio brasiliensis]QUS55031.1 TIM44-like domain-containing protein [Pseudovibrio brasiliensis]
MLALNKFPRFLTLLVFSIGLIFVTADFAEAKRGFSFGSRGSRSYSAPKATKTAPKTAPVQRTMTPNNGTNTGAQQTNAAAASKAAAGQQRRGLFGGGFLGSMLGGLALGGLLGMLFGSGFGGMAGFFGLIVQALLIGGGIMLLMRFLRSRQQPQAAGAYGHHQQQAQQSQPFTFNDAGAQDAPRRSGSSGIPNTGFGGGQSPQFEEQPVFSTEADDEIGLTADDFDAFEALLTTVWTAYGSENYGKIREIATPEIMGYFAEELGKAASNGLINEVRDIKLLQGDLTEAWREGDKDYASVAMRYESIDVMRERATNKVVEGNADVPEERTEIWTFIRGAGENWQLSAIQQAG